MNRRWSEGGKENKRRGRTRSVRKIEGKREIKENRLSEKNWVEGYKEGRKLKEEEKKQKKMEGKWRKGEREKKVEKRVQVEVAFKEE